MDPLIKASGIYPISKSESGGCGAACASADVVTADFARAINSAGADLCVKLNKRRSLAHKNFVFFTPNILALFSMLYAGAPSGPKEALEEFLKVREFAGDYHVSFNNWISNLSARSVAQTAYLEKTAKEANKFFFRQAQAIVTAGGITIPTDTKNRLANYNPVQISFKTAAEAQSLTNSWVEEQTEGKITNLVKDLNENTVLILVTAALYHGKWIRPFYEEENSIEAFRNSDETSVPVTMMNNEGYFRLYSDLVKNIAVCELPFYGNNSVLIVNPQGDSGSAAATCLSEFMIPAHLLEMLEHFEERALILKMNISIPKINIKDETEFFDELGSDPLIQSLSSNWSGSLVNSAIPTSIGAVCSEVQFQMDEAGAKVAAAAFSCAVASAGPCEKIFNIRGPFGVVLFDRVTKTILGIGQFFKFEAGAISAQRE